MASFSDQIPVFNPYVQQLPIEQMVHVGMQKQAQYNEGVQKIQANIDNVAGLDIANEADKKYLQSKLSQLGNNLKTVAAGDFSNFQLVNSVNGMTNQITKDENIVNAVSSTSWLKKQKAEMEKAIAEGKSSQSNIYDFNKQADAYLSSTNVGEKFNGRYSQFVDVKKKAFEAIKALHPNLKELDMPFVQDANGNIDASKVADAMKRMKIEGISEGQIKQAISANLTPDDMHQLSIDANYQFKGITPDILKEKIVADYSRNKNVLIEELKQLNEDRKITTDPTKLSQISEAIKNYEDQLGKEGQIGSLDKSFNERLQTVDNNPDLIKFDIYKEGFINEYANAFKWKSESSQYVASPLKAQQNFVTEMRHKQAVLQSENYFKGENLKVSQANSNIQKERNNIAIEKMRLEAFEKAKEKAGDVNAPWTPIGNPTENANMAYERFNNNKKDVSDDITADNSLLLKSGLSQNAINSLLNKWQESQGTANVSAGQKTILARMAKNNNYLEALNTWNNNLRKSTYDSVFNDPENKELIANSIVGKPSLNLNYNGTKISLTPQEILGIQNATISPINYSGGTGGRSTLGQVSYDMSKLNENQKRFLRFKNIVDKNPNAREIQNNISKTFSSFGSVASVAKEIENKANELYKNKLSEYSNAFVPQIKAVATDKTGKIPTQINIGLNQLIYASESKGIKGNADYNAEIAKSFLNSENVKNTKVYVEQNGKNYKVILTNEKDKNQELILSKNDITKYLGAGYVNNLEQESSRLVYGKGNTNLNNNPLKASMQKQFGDFQNIRSYQITADVKERIDNPESFIPGVNIKKKDGTYTYFELYPISGEQVGYEQAKNNLNLLNDELLEKALKVRYPNYDFSNLLKK